MSGKVKNFPLEDTGVYFNSCSENANLDSLARELYIEVAKLDVICDTCIPIDVMRTKIEERAKSLKVIVFNLQMIKDRYEK